MCKLFYEAWKCRKFEEGLRLELERTITPICVHDSPALVEKDRLVKKLEGSSSQVACHHEGSARGKGKVQ